MDMNSFYNVIRTVGSEKNWSPRQLGKLYVDEADYEGLIFWYNEILQQINNQATRE